jgi:hypothetical protein
MATVLGEEGVNVDVRMQAGIQAKNFLSAKDEVEQAQKAQGWKTLPVETRTYIKTCYLKTLNSTEQKARHTAAMTIAKVAGIELPEKLWPDLFSMLIQGVRHTSQAVTTNHHSLFFPNLSLSLSPIPFLSSPPSSPSPSPFPL